jgi:prepilin peptidase CpaA
MELTSTVLFSVGALVLSVVAAGWDIATRRIPNPLTLTAMGCGLLGHLSLTHGHGLAWSAAGLTVGLGLMLPPALLGSLGGGDLKLMAALGALLGPGAAFEIALVAALAGGALAFAAALRRRAVGTALQRAATPWRLRTLTATANVPKPATPVTVGTIPYGVAIGAATWICLLAGGPFS